MSETMKHLGRLATTVHGRTLDDGTCLDIGREIQDIRRKQTKECIVIKASSEQLIKVFEFIHGPVSESCRLQVQYDAHYNPIAVAVMKDSQVAWVAGLEELAIDCFIKTNGI